MLSGNCKVPIWKRGIAKRGILRSLVSHVLNFKSWIKLIHGIEDVCDFVINVFNPIFSVKTLKTRHFKMPRLAMPHFQTRRWVTVASGQWVLLWRLFKLKLQPAPDKAFLGFVGTILRNWQAKIPSQPHFLGKNGTFFNFRNQITFFRYKFEFYIISAFIWGILHICS